MKKYLNVISFLSILFLTSCSSSTSLFGLEGNADKDKVDSGESEYDVTDLKDMFTAVSKISKFTYETTITLESQSSHFISYYLPKVYYEKNDDESLSFGYAEEADTSYLFKFYLDENNKAIPSIYEYISMDEDDMNPLTDLYDVFSVASTTMLSETLDTFSAISLGNNTFTISDSETASIFQYMTTYGTAITDYMSNVKVEIIDYLANIFEVTVNLVGSYGSIVSRFTPIEESFLDEVETEVENGTLKGISSYNDVTNFLNKAATNDYVIEGIKSKEKNGYSNPYYRIHLTNSYFYLEYLAYDTSGNEIPNSSYDNYGLAYVKKGQSIALYSKNSSGIYEESEVIGPLNYDACFGFVQDSSSGNFYFDYFKGPVETDSIKYLEVDTLPEEGDSSILYIVPDEDGTKTVYEWVEVSDSDGNSSYKFSKYSSWYSSVGDFGINTTSDSFYLTASSGLTTVGAHLFEKSSTESSFYYSKDTDIISLVCNGLFGWGFQSTTTWMEYTNYAYLEPTYEDENLVSANFGVGVSVTSSGITSTQDFCYTYDFTKSGNVDEVETFFKNGGISLYE